MKTLKTTLGAALFAALLTTASAQPAYLNYQGRLTDNNGQPLPSSGTNNLEFNIYTAATSGTLLWGPFLCDGGAGAGHAPRTIVSSGRFNVILGPTDTASRSITTIFTTNDTLFLEIRVNGAAILPRQQFLTAAYAFEASHADQSSTVSDPNVAYENTANVFAATNRFAGLVQATNVNNSFAGSFIGSGMLDVPWAKFSDQKPKGTGTPTTAINGRYIRYFNTLVNSQGLGSFNNSTNISLPAGTYYCRIRVPAFRITSHQARLKNVTAGTFPLYGTSEVSSDSTGGDTTWSEITGQFTLGTQSILQVEQTLEGDTGNGLGYPGPATAWPESGTFEIYTVAEFWKIK
jgi:hypothetical protein